MKYLLALLVMLAAASAQAQVQLVQAQPKGTLTVCKNPEGKKVAGIAHIAAASPLLKDPANVLIIYYCPSDTPANACTKFNQPPWKKLVRCDGNAKGVCYSPPIGLQDPRSVSLYFLPIIYSKTTRKPLTGLQKPLAVAWEDKGEECPTQKVEDTGFRIQLCVNNQCCNARNNDHSKLDINLPLTAGASPPLTITSASNGYSSAYGISIGGSSARGTQRCPNASSCDWNLPGFPTAPPSEDFEAGLMWDGKSAPRARLNGGNGDLADGADCIITVHY